MGAGALGAMGATDAVRAAEDPVSRASPAPVAPVTPADGAAAEENEVTGGATGVGAVCDGVAGLGDDFDAGRGGEATAWDCACDKYACVSQITAAHSATASTTPTASKRRSRLSLFSGAPEFSRPYPSVWRTASVCAVLGFGPGGGVERPRLSASRISDISNSG